MIHEIDRATLFGAALSIIYTPEYIKTVCWDILLRR